MRCFVVALGFLVGCSAPGDLGLRDSSAHPRYLVGERDKTIDIDGRLDDEGWARVASTGAFRNEIGKATQWTEARILVDDENLFIAIDTRGWEDMSGMGIDIDVDLDLVVEQEIWIDGGTDPYWDGPQNGKFGAVHLTSKRYGFEMSLPLSTFGLDSPPVQGDVWRIRMYRLDDSSDLTTAQLWSERESPPIESNLAFGYLDFLGAPLP